MRDGTGAVANGRVDLHEPAAGGPRRSRCERLSRKERLVLAELARGNSTEEIGLVLSVSPHTVRTHVKNLMRKLGARTRAHAVAIALSERAIEVSP
jgi:DNA-binding CsgD family transcriptional regulator